MTCIVNGADLVLAAKAVRHALAKRGIHEMLQAIRLVPVGDSVLRLEATDHEIAISATVDAKWRGDPFGVLAVEGAKFVTAVDKLSGSEEYRLSVDDKNELSHGTSEELVASGRLLLADERGLFSFAAQRWDDGEYEGVRSVTTDPDHCIMWSTPASAFYALFRDTVFATSTEASRPILNGVRFRRRDGVLQALATDGHRLAEVSLAHRDAEDARASEGTIIIPRRGIEAFMRTVPDRETVDAYTDNKWISFVADAAGVGLTVSTVLIGGAFPDVQFIWDQFEKGGLDIRETQREWLAAALGRAKVAVSNVDQRVAIKLDEIVHTVSVDPRTSTVAFSEDYGMEREVMVPDSERPAPRKMTVNVSYLTEMLGAGPQTQFVRFGFIDSKDNTKPILLEPVSGPEDELEEVKFRAIIMPMMDTR